VVTCMDVVEHLPEPVRAPMFGEVRRVLKPGGRFVLQTPHARTFQALDAQNLRHRFPALYRRLLRRGGRDQAYAGWQDVVWHSTSLATGSSGSPPPLACGPSSVSRAPRVAAGRAVDVAVSRSGRTDHALARWLVRALDWDARRDYGSKRGYEILVTLSRKEGEREPGERRTHATSET
jgi:SAM-dependent methyltransferase